MSLYSSSGNSKIYFTCSFNDLLAIVGLSGVADGDLLVGRDFIPNNPLINFSKKPCFLTPVSVWAGSGGVVVSFDVVIGDVRFAVLSTVVESSSV